MMKSVGLIGVLLFVLTGCASGIVKAPEFGGFLTNYEQLNKSVSADNQEVLRWVSPKFKKGNYAKANFEKIVFYPKPHQSEQVDGSLLSNLKTFMDGQIRTSAQSRGILSPTAGEGVVTVKTGITGIKVTTESLKPLEIIPFKLVMAGAGAAIGFRDKDVYIYVEVSGEDSVTKEPLFSVVRKIKGEQLSSKWDQMELVDVQAAISQFVVAGIDAMAAQLRGKS